MLQIEKQCKQICWAISCELDMGFLYAISHASLYMKMLWLNTKSVINRWFQETNFIILKHHDIYTKDVSQKIHNGNRAILQTSITSI